MAIVVLAVALPLGAESAHSNYNKGVDAEKRQDYERAFEYFQEAFRQKPKELRYRTAYEHTKFLASAAHVHRGQLLRDGGKLDEAIVEFQKASAIDPSSFIAQQELRRTQDMDLYRVAGNCGRDVRDLFRGRRRTFWRRSRRQADRLRWLGWHGWRAAARGDHDGRSISWD